MKQCKNYARRAFTLVEIAIVLVIIGLMSAVILQSGQVANPDNCYAATQRQLAEINAAITSYARANGRYPLPAGRSFGVASPYFGREVSSALSADIDAAGGNLFGALPFQTLGLNESYAADCWGNKFSYVVTEALTGASALTSGSVGGLTVKSGGLGASTDLLTDAVYAVISHGADGVGGVTKNHSDTGNHGWCGAPTTVEMENCNNDSTLFSTTYNNGEGSGASYYDDLIVFSGVLGSNCDAGSYPGLTWGDGTGPSLAQCTGSVSGPLTSGSSGSATSLAPAGTAHFICRNGNVELDTTQDYTCDGCTYPAGGGAPTCGSSSCPVQAVTWDTGVTPGPCGGNTTLWVDGETGIVNNTAPGYTGTASFTCNNGVLSLQQATCTPDVVDCTTLSTTLTWDVNGSPGAPGPCTATISPGTFASDPAVGAIPHDTTAVPDYDGTAFVQCTNGVISIIQSPCNSVLPNACPSGPLSWGIGCSATFPSVPDASNSPTVGTQANTAPGYTGSAIAKCNMGVLTISWSSCAVASCPSTVLSWTDSGNTCSATFGPAAAGASESHPNDTGLSPGLGGTGNATCNAGVWSAATGTCGPVGSVPCPAGFLTKTSTDTLATCKYFMWDTGDFPGMQSPQNETPGYAGGSDITCDGATGTWNMLGAGCAPMTGTNYYGQALNPTMTENCPSSIMEWGNGCYSYNAYTEANTGVQAYEGASPPGSVATVCDHVGGCGAGGGSATFTCEHGAWKADPGASCTKVTVFCGNNPGCNGTSYDANASPLYCDTPGACKSETVTQNINCDGTGGASHTFTRYYCVGERHTTLMFTH